MNFCSHCGSAQLVFKIPEGDNRPRYICSNCGVIHYSNPKIVTGCLPIWRNRVLLAKRAIEPRKNYWNVPSGYMENGETVEQGAAREVLEETLAKVAGLTLHTVFSIPHINQVYIHFLAELDKPDFGIGEESLEVRLFTEEDIPWKEIAFTSSVFTLKHYFEDLRKGRREVHMGGME
ncbi:MAG: NUDIX hydrolase [Phaeodactylibacter sp.]|nr:NUDIX hydrolase [Phaeodactylibacter sp.]MCB0616416.1 NUDIX hydrolase [Phaeodactylibacter sp.]